MAKARVLYLSDYRNSGNLLSKDLIAKLERHFAEAGLTENSASMRQASGLRPDYADVLPDWTAVPEKAE
ncbi:MAG: hypothetical protein M0T70_05190 [Geobacteraceae bacterium]|nr:hypothetical protein [Geobacteraceae bacterium]